MSDEVITNNEEHDKSARPEHGFAKAAGWVVAAACFLGIGWLAGSMYTGKKIMAAMAARQAGGNPMAAMMNAPGLVKAEPVSYAVVNPPWTYIGRVEPIRDVALRAEVAGMVRGVHFQEGAVVKAGDLLFTIDAEPYEARVAARNAEVAQAESALNRAELLLARLEAADSRAVSQLDIDNARGEAAQWRAGVLQAKAGLSLAEIDLRNTKITAPIDGRTGRAAATTGDYVAPAMGTLVRIVQTDPIRVAFSVTDKDYVEARENIADERLQDTLRARVQLPTGTIPEMTGERDFEDNVMSAGTASVGVRVRFSNEHGLLVPGGYVTVLVDLAKPEPVLAVPKKALKWDTEGAFVMLVGEESKAEQRRVVTGAEADGLVAIREGLNEGDRVVVEGLLNARPGRVLKIAGEEDE